MMPLPAGSLCGQALAPSPDPLLFSGTSFRCASPGDNRRFTGLKRGAPEIGGTGALPCSGSGALPFGAWEPGDRGSAPGALASWGSKSPLASARASPQLQFDALAERVGSLVVGLQRQCDTDKRASDRRFQQLERQLSGAIGRLEGDNVRDNDWREKFSLLQGSMNGLVDESQALARRVDALDERLWTRTNGAEELSRQGSRDLALQVQAFERQARLSAAAVEEGQKRQATRQRRAEHMLEELASRVAKAEERHIPDAHMQATELRSQASEHRLQELGAEVGATGARLQALEAQLEAVTQTIAESAQPAFCATVDEHVPEDGMCSNSAATGDLQSSFRTLAHDLSALERRVAAQWDELSVGVASLRVKVDGQVQRQASMADRFETVHMPAIESLRNELMGTHARDIGELRGLMGEFERKLDRNLQALDLDSLVDKLERLSQRVSGGDASISALRREVHELRGNVDRRSRYHGRGPTSLEMQGPTIQEQLGAVADQLEVLDDMAGRVSDLQNRVTGLEKKQLSAVAHGTSASHDNGMKQHVSDLQHRVTGLEKKQFAALVHGTSASHDTGIKQDGMGDRASPTIHAQGVNDVRIGNSGPTHRLAGGSGPKPISEMRGLDNSAPPSPCTEAKPNNSVPPLPCAEGKRTFQMGFDSNHAAHNLGDGDRYSDNLHKREHGIVAREALRAPAVQQRAVGNLAPVTGPPAAPPLSRKGSLESSFSCDVEIAQDECIEPSFEDVLQSRCDVTMNVESRSRSRVLEDASSAGSPAAYAESGDLSERSSNGSSVHRSFEDDDIASLGSED